MTEKALRYNIGKPQLSYILSAPHANNALADVFAFGAEKYARDNWKNGLPPLEIVDSLLRHLEKYVNGEDLDADSQLPHVAHVHWNAMALSEMVLQGMSREEPTLGNIYMEIESRR